MNTLSRTTELFAVFAHGSFWGLWNAGDVDSATVLAAKERGTDGDTTGLIAVPARQSILAARRDAASNDVDLLDTIRECFNCHEVDIDADGDVWIAAPQSGHWLGQDELEKLIAFITR